MILVEVGEPTLRRKMENMGLNESLAVNLNIICKLRDKVRIREEATKVRASRRYNIKMQLRSFRPGDLVWRMHSNVRKEDDKFLANYGGPFWIQSVVGKGAYRLEYLSGKPILRMWNATHLSFISVKSCNRKYSFLVW